MKTLLLTNDDGYLAEGIRHLKDYFSTKYDVYLVAPDRERSAISMSLSIHGPLRIKQINGNEFAVDGTPTDCITIALKSIMPHPPDFIVSGMNLGENLAEDVFFSGTVAGAFTGNLYGIPSMAVSLAGDKKQPLPEIKYNFRQGAEITGGILEKLLPLQNNRVAYNVNIPNPTKGEIAITTLGSKRYQPTTTERLDPRGQKYYWIGAGSPNPDMHPGTDLHAIAKGRVSVSVLKYDLNCVEEMNILKEVINEN